ncbi:MAG TPA: glycosyltransferase [Cyclobacteriaceae bacterium]
MTASPLVSVIIPTYNHAHFLREALESVCAQTHANWEAVVINNYSEDNTVEVVESFKDPRIRLENFRNNGVIAASRNRGIALARGKYLAFLDSDDLWLPEKLACCITRLEGGCDLVCHGLRWFGKGRERDKFYGPMHHATFDALLYRGNCIATSATVVRKDLVVSVGGVSEEPEIVTAEDYHLWLKLARAGAKMDFIDQVLGGYRLHSANTGTAIRQAKAVKHVVEDFFPEEQSRSLRDRIRVRFRYGIIDYGIGRCMQANDQFFSAWSYFLHSLALHPFYFKTYIALALNVFLSTLIKKDLM